MIVSGGGAVVGIAPWSASVERNGTCGSMKYSKLRIKGRLRPVEEPESACVFDDEPKDVVPPPAELPTRFAVELAPVAAPGAAPNFDFAAATALVTASIDVFFDRDVKDRRWSRLPLMLSIGTTVALRRLAKPRPEDAETTRRGT